MTKTPEEKPAVKENLTSEENEYECAFENLQNILDNPANKLNQMTRDMIETSIRLLRLQSKELKAYREALKETTNALQERCDKYGMSPIEHEVLAKAKQLLKE